MYLISIKRNKSFHFLPHIIANPVLYVLTVLAIFSSCDAIHSNPPNHTEEEKPSIEDATDISEITGEQLIEYFKIDHHKPASEQQQKIPANSPIKIADSEIYAEVIAYTDGTTSSEKGSITVQLRSPAKNQANADIIREIIISDILNPYNSGLETLQDYEIDFSAAIENNLPLADFIPTIQTHLRKLSFFTYGKQSVDLLQSNKYYRSEITFKKNGERNIDLEVTYYAKIYDFTKGKAETCTEKERSIRHGILPEKSYFSPKDVFNHIVNDEKIIGSQKYPQDFASKYYGFSLENPAAGGESFFSKEYIAACQAKYAGDDYKDIVVGIESLNANDVTGELYISYYVTTENNLPIGGGMSDLNKRSNLKTHTFTGFKKVNSEVLTQIFNPRVIKVKESNSSDFARIFTRTDTKFTRNDTLSEKNRSWYVLFNGKEIGELVFKTDQPYLALYKTGTPIFVESCWLEKVDDTFTFKFEILSHDYGSEATEIFEVVVESGNP